MFKPISLFIGLRYTRAKRRNRFISFVSLSSMIGIMLGIAILITVLSIMNGFNEVVKERVFGMARQVSITYSDSGTEKSISRWQILEQRLSKHPAVVATAPFVDAQGLLSYHGVTRPSILVGIIPEQEQYVSTPAQNMVLGSLFDLRPGEYGIVLGHTLAENMGLQLGDKITVLTPEVAVTPAGVLPRAKRFTLIGTFQMGKGFGFDTGLAFIHLNDAQTLLKLDNQVSGLNLKIKNLLIAPEVATDIFKLLDGKYFVSDWTQDYGEFFHFIQLEKTMMFFVLMLIIAIAVFNLVSSLVMVVADKNADIAILRTMGATPGLIMRIFMVQGSIIGIVGTLLGLTTGLALAANATYIAGLIENLLHIKFFSSNINFVNYVPSKIEALDVLKICISALVMSFLATLYPAWRAARVQPAEALRYE